MDYGKKARQIRLFLDVDQVTLSRITGINRSDLSLFESGKKPLRAERVEDICKALGVESLDPPLETILINLVKTGELEAIVA